MNRIRNQQVAGSNPIAGSKKIKGLRVIDRDPFCFTRTLRARLQAETELMLYQSTSFHRNTDRLAIMFI